MKPIIEVRNLSKKYKIGEQQRYLSLRDSVSNLFSKKNTPDGSGQVKGSEFWALDDVSFDVHAGESIGIIGRNGAGKSTLLKILSRITPPTKGSVILRGRMASLLEVGTGFHSELTGRENVFMNGSILGLKKREIEAKFDEIVDFSGVEQFIDTPLKHYSSGMQLRLAFAVAAHLEPEILVIDEVLAVGDAEFQKRCLGKMDEVSRSGRTVLFVSHNLGAIESLCAKSLFLFQGKLIKLDKTSSIISAYSSSVGNNSNNSILSVPFQGSLKNLIVFNKVFINGVDPFQTSIVSSPTIEIKIAIYSKISESVKPFKITLSIFCNGIRIFSLHDSRYPKMTLSTNIESVFKIPKNVFRPGIYSIALGAHEEGYQSRWLWATDICFFEILEEWNDELDPINLGIINIPLNTVRNDLV